MAFLRGSSIYCIKEKEISHFRREIFSTVCTTTAAISSFGAIVQLINWSKRMCLAEPRRVPSPKAHIVFSLALADLFTCLGAISMSTLFLTLKTPSEVHSDSKDVKPYDEAYVDFGLPIEAFTMFSYICSYLWTLFYSIDICLQVHNHSTSFNSKAYHVMSWPLAAWLVACVQCAVYFTDPENCSYGIVALVHYLVCYIPLFLVMVTLPFIYLKTYRKVTQNVKRSGYFTDIQREAQTSVKKRFFLIVLVFTVCWLPNFIDGFHDIIHFVTKKDGSMDDQPNHFPVWMIEASINPLQGFLNCLVYGQHKPFTACCTHILSSCRHESTDPSNDRDNHRQNKALTINSLSGSVKIPVSEISRLLSGGSGRNTPSVYIPPINSPSEPFSARLLGEERY